MKQEVAERDFARDRAHRTGQAAQRVRETQRGHTYVRQAQGPQGLRLKSSTGNKSAADISTNRQIVAPRLRTRPLDQQNQQNGY